MPFEQNAFNYLLLNTPSPELDLELRTDWLFEMLRWIRLAPLEGTTPAMRLQLLLDFVDKNNELKKKLARTLRSIIHDTKGLELFTQVGMLKGDSLISEFRHRVYAKLPLRAPEAGELKYILSEHIRSPKDIDWIELLDVKSLSRLIDLFHFEVSEAERDWNTLRVDAGRALLLLSIRFQGIGLSSDLRKRFSQADFQKLPFYELPGIVKEFVETSHSQTKKSLGLEIRQKLEDSQLCLQEVLSHLNEHGVSIAIVYEIERLECLIQRMKSILDLLQYQSPHPFAISEFMHTLIQENIDRQSISDLLNKNLALLSRKIVERTGETGEHYITRTVPEHLSLLKSSLGGGLLTGFTTLVKFLISAQVWSGLLTGAMFALNYSLSFLAIHFCNFTLGTKQPSMTASSLAAELNNDLEKIVDEVIHLIRSQFAAIFGNIMGVVPVMIFVSYFYNQFAGSAILDEEKATHIVQEFSILGSTPLFAYFTGILLWLSSVISGWVDNFFVFHRLTCAISSHKGLIFLFGADRAKSIALTARKHVLGVTSSVSLGILLGLAPWYMQSWGIYLDVRHVTLSSGAITAAMMSLPSSYLLSKSFLLAVLGILSMGVLNVTVSFALAFSVAIHARKVEAPKRFLIYRLILLRIAQAPFSLFWPQKEILESPKEISDSARTG